MCKLPKSLDLQPRHIFVFNLLLATISNIRIKRNPNNIIVGGGCGMWYAEHLDTVDVNVSIEQPDQ